MYKINVYLFITISVITLIFVLYSLSSQHVEMQEPQFAIEEIETIATTSNFNYSQIFDLNLSYVIDNSDACENSSNILAVILVTSYFGNVETRSAMRRSFPNNKLKLLGLRRVFLLGIAPQDHLTTQKSVENEAKRFGDIIQGNFLEAYRNLTYKHVMGMTWACKFCSNAKYVIKMDDDIVVSIAEFVPVLRNLTLPRNSIAGYILRGMHPIREPHNKWYVTKEEYRAENYPTFVSGWFYITTPKVFSNLLYIMYLTKPKYFWIDDLFVTGILASKVKVRYYDIGKYFAVHSEFLECCINDVEKQNVKCDFLIGPNGGDNNLFYTFNEAVKQCVMKPCDVRREPIKETCIVEKKVHLDKGNAIIRDYKLH